jgi:serine/threonine protein kinase/tetratricopeptide (TPR) repeat protein
VRCLDDDQLLALLEHRLSPDAAASVQEHVDGCDQCRALVADVIGADAPTKLANSAEVADATATRPQLLPRGAAVGRYVVLDLVGRGGMGVVYGAYDRELDRRVALKLVRTDSRVSRELNQRLVREAQALARVSHPNVVHVYEVGEWNEQLFIAMEWVDGTTLAQWLREGKRDRPEILRMFIAAGRGLAAAHAAGLVHRDFKPDNVMIGRDERARVTDFGLARPAGLAGPSENASPDSPLYRDLTATGAVVGTPGYMAPEQLRGDVTDARSDLFSFCVALYEALTGVRPFAGRTRQELLDAIEKGEPQPGRVAELPRELRRALASGLKQKSDERHPTMEALLTELAYDPHAGRRRRMTALAAIAMVALGALALVQLDRRHGQLCRGAEQKLAGIWDRPRRAHVHDAFVATKVSFAEPVWQSMANTLDDYTRRWTAMHTQACEETRLRGSQSEEVMELRMECLDRRRGEVGALVDQFAQADAHVVERAARAAQDLSSLEECRNADALRQVVRPPSDAKAHARVVELRGRLASTEAKVQAGRFAEAAKLAEAALTDAREVGYAPVIAEALYWRGQAEHGLGNPQAAAETLFAAAAAAETGRDDHQRALSVSALVFELGPMLGRYADAQGLLSVARAALARAGGDATLEVRLDSYEAMLLTLQDKVDDALALQKRVVVRTEALLGPSNERVAAAYHALGAMYHSHADYEHAIEAYARSLAIRQSIYGRNHPDTANTLAHIGEAWFEKGETEAPMKAFAEALAIREALFGPDHPDVAFSLTNLASALTRAGQLEKARAALERARKIQLNTLGPIHPEIAYNELISAWLYYRLGKLDIALEQAERALAQREQIYGKGHSQPAEALAWIGKIRVARREYQAAFSPLEGAIAVLEHHPDDPQYLAEARFALAIALWDTGRDRVRARSLALAARDHLVDDRATLEAWLAQHR